MGGRLVWVLILLAIAFAYRGTSSEIRHGPGVIAPQDPKQTSLSNGNPFQFNGYTFRPLATFEVEARVLSKERYWLGREADLSPFDLALGWGAMSNEAVLDEIDISQGGRFYRWWTDTLGLPPKVIASHSANMHMIPADGEVGAALKRVRKGNLVQFSGYLVSIQADDGWHWVSSLTREDVGAGACEVVWVEKLAVL
jgi:hypothetical protein